MTPIKPDPTGAATPNLPAPDAAEHAAEDAAARQDAQAEAVAAAPEPPAPDLRARVISAIILAPLAIAAAWAQAPIFAGAIAAGGVILAREWTRMSDPDGPDHAFALVAGAAAGGTIAASAGQMEAALAWIGVCAAVAGAASWRRGVGRDALFGALYVGLPCAALVWLRLFEAPAGSIAVTFLFAAVWGADIGAYAAGKLIGGPRLFTSISPNKTWSGVMGGLVLSVAFGLGAARLMGLEASTALVAATALALGAAGLLGDLLESGIKRRYGVKDTGALIPGHGGLLDRVDGLMLAAGLMAVLALTGSPLLEVSA